MAQLKQKVLVASAARTTSSNSGLIDFVDIGEWDNAVVELAVTTVTGTSPTLDLYVQETLDGTNFIDVAHFTQVTGVLAIPHRVALSKGVTTDAVKEGVGDATATAGQLGFPLVTNHIRIKWVVAGTTPSFTFAVNGYADTR